MSKRTCENEDCDSTIGVGPYHDGRRTWHLCNDCRSIMARMDLEDLARREAELLAEWGTIGQKRTA